MANPRTDRDIILHTNLEVVNKKMLAINEHCDFVNCWSTSFDETDSQLMDRIIFAITLVHNDETYNKLCNAFLNGYRLRIVRTGDNIIVYKYKKYADDINDLMNKYITINDNVSISYRKAFVEQLNDDENYFKSIQQTCENKKQHLYITQESYQLVYTFENIYFGDWHAIDGERRRLELINLHNQFNANSDNVKWYGLLQNDE